MRRVSETRWSMIRAAQAGDEEALRALDKKYRPVVVGWLVRRGLGDEAEDVAQEVLLGLNQALTRVDRRAGRFRSLLFAIARNLLARHLQRRGAQKRGGGQVQLLGAMDVLTGEETPDADFDREWLANLLRGALERLGREHPTYLEALRRFLLQGDAQADIARALDISEGTVKKRVHRGRRKLMGYLKEEVWSTASSAADYEAEVAYVSRLLEEAKLG